jgi:hypothetical protein
MVHMLIQTAILATYEGDAQDFNDNFELFITPTLDVVIAPSGEKVLTEKFKSKLTVALKGIDKSFNTIYAETCNFKGVSKEEAESVVGQELNERMSSLPNVLLQANPALFDVIAEDTLQDSPEGKDIIKAITTLPYVENVRIQFKDKTFLQIPTEGSSSEPETSRAYPKLATGRPDRETVISEDDQCNLQIALGLANTVDEFLALI